MNNVELSNQQFMEELLSLEALLRLMNGREPSEWMINNVMSLLNSLKSRAFQVKQQSMADVIHFMQKVLIELPFYAAHDLLLRGVDVCIQVFEDAEPGALLKDLTRRYEECIKTVFAPAATVAPLRR